MTRLAILALLAINDQVAPCGSALCIGGPGQPITLGGTVQASQGYIPDGGSALLTPVVQGARLEIVGQQSDPNDGGYAAQPDVVIRSRNSRQAAGPPIVSIRSNALEVAKVNTDGTAQFSAVSNIDGGAMGFTSITASSALTSGSYACDGGTPAPSITVLSGVHCVCNRTTGAVCTTSGTTLTGHCVSGDTGPLSYICL